MTSTPASQKKARSRAIARIRATICVFPARTVQGYITNGVWHGFEPTYSSQYLRASRRHILKILAISRNKCATNFVEVQRKMGMPAQYICYDGLHVRFIRRLAATLVNFLPQTHHSQWHNNGACHLPCQQSTNDSIRISRRVTCRISWDSEYWKNNNQSTKNWVFCALFASWPWRMGPFRPQQPTLPAIP